MTQISSINLSALDDAMESEMDTQDIEYWYEQLSELDIDGTETPEALEIICRGYKWILQYEHTNVEELKEIAEKEAVEMAEKEENWEQEKEMLKEELSSMRERITSRAGADDMNEAFRAEIDSLKAESNHLKQQLRERDRELADQRDKNEELSARFEVAEKERTLLITNQSQLEDTIRELNRRITTRNDASRSDWEARKLKQRSEQAVTLSNQLQKAVQQNDHLQSEVNRLSNALEQATTLIKDTTDKYASIREAFINSEKTVEKLLDDNQTLKRQLLKRESSFSEKEEVLQSTTKDYESLVKQKDSQLDKYKESIQKQQMELEEHRAKLALATNEEKEAELERLRLELVEATKVARLLFGSMTDDTSKSLDPTAELRVRIVQLDKQLELCEQKLRQLEEQNTKLEQIAVEKDELNARISGELHRIRKVAFGEADEEMKHLEQQIRFRDAQIKELTTKCSLLQIELERYVVGGAVPLNEAADTVPHSRRNTPARTRGAAVKCPPAVAVRRPVVSRAPHRHETESEREREQAAAVSGHPPRQRELTEEYLDDVEASAMIISSLNYELMKVMKENEDKARLLKEMDKAVQDHTRDLQLARAKIGQLMRDYAGLKAERLVSADAGYSGDEVEEARTRQMEETEIRLVELERLAESIKHEGPELHRRMEEASRKLIYVQIKNSEFQRRAENASKTKEAALNTIDRLRHKLRAALIGENRKLKELSRDYEMHMIEIARLQNTLIHSVPLAQYDKILKSYKQLAQKTGLNVDYNSINDFAFDPSLSVKTTSIAANFDVSEQQTASVIENLTLKVNQLQQLNEVLENQSDFLQKEARRQENELHELRSFLDDIEGHTELKALVVNIERRFLQALHEQADSFDEQFFSEKQLRTTQKKFDLRKKAWRRERQNLVNVVLRLQQQVQQLRAQTTSGLRVEHLVAVREAAEDLKEKESELKARQDQLRQDEDGLGVQRAMVEAQAGAVKDLVDNDFNLQRLQKTIQGYQFNVLALSNELRASKKGLEAAEARCTVLETKVRELEREAEHLQLTQIDVARLSAWKDDDEEEEEVEGLQEGEPADVNRRGSRTAKHEAIQKALDKAIKKADRRAPVGDEDSSADDSFLTDSSRSSTDLSSSAPEAAEVPQTTRTSVIYDNTAEYQKQLQHVKDTAKICVQSFQEQLEHKDRAIQQYKTLLLDVSRQLGEKQRLLDELQAVEGRRRQQEEPVERIKTSADILNDVRMDEKEREINLFRLQVKELERMNAELSAHVEQLEGIGPARPRPPKQPKAKKSPPKTPQKPPEVAPLPIPAQESTFENDFESDDSGSETAKTPVPEDFEESPGDAEDSTRAGTSGEEDSDEAETSDSGTVEDIDEQPRRPSRSSSASSRKSSADATKPPPPEHQAHPPPSKENEPKKPAPLVVAGDDREHVIYGQRNEIRKLRDRVATLERRARLLEAERDSWKERNRYGAKKEFDESAEAAAAKKENERLKRESKNLTRTLENQKKAIDDLQKALSRRATALQSKESLEHWEDKKRREAALAQLRKRAEEAAAREKELEERLERRERHVEQLQQQVQQQGLRSHDTDKVQQMLRLLKTEKDSFDQRETHLRQEADVWQAKAREVMARLESSGKENRSLKTRLQQLQARLEDVELQLTSHPHVPAPPPQRISPKKAADMQVQTSERAFPAARLAPVHSRQLGTLHKGVQTTEAFPPAPPARVQPLESPSRRADRSPPPTSPEGGLELQRVKRELRMAELRRTELEEEVERLKRSYNSLQESYTRVLRIEKERDKPRDSDKIAAISVLRDKLVAKDREIESQRHHIDRLERRLFSFTNRAY